jgi:hypothetical protein
MSARGWLVTSPGSSRSACLSESARYIPLFWLSFLSPDDIENAEHYGQFRLDRKRAVEHSSDRIRFFSSLFPQIRSFQAVADSLTKRVASEKCKTIGIELVELLHDESDAAMPSLKAAVGAIESQNSDYSFTIPARTIANPFSGENVRLKERCIRTTQQLLLEICMIEPDFLTSKKSNDYVRETIIGHVWE